MELVNQNKYRNFLIAFLLVLNLLTVSIIWMTTAKKIAPPSKAEDHRSSESVKLMKEALDLSESQAVQLEKIFSDQQEQSKSINDSLNELKKQLAEVLFAGKNDTIASNSKIRIIGELQSKAELIRYKLFANFLSFCTPEQKEKLKPVVVELFSRKPQKIEQQNPRPKIKQGEQKSGKENTAIEPPKDEGQNQRSEIPAPPAIDKKLSKYSVRLNLSAEQTQKARVILNATRQKGEDLRAKQNPESGEIESGKEKIRLEENGRIMEILNEYQKKEFEKMIANRRR